MTLKLSMAIGINLLLASCLLNISYADSAPLDFQLDMSEGGRLTAKSISQFESYMTEQGCDLEVNTQAKQGNENSPDLYFSALSHIYNNKGIQPPLTKALSVATINNEPLTITILIKSSTNVDDISSLTGERLAIISHNSYLGGLHAKDLLSKFGASLDKQKIYETGNYFGAMSLLLHGDVFIAAIPGPLARQWKTYNKLSIITESEPLESGGMFIKPSVPQTIRSLCIAAFTSLKKEHRRDKKMDIFPSWLGGFQ